MKYKNFFMGKKLIFFKGFTLVVITGLLALTRYFQLDYIKLYESPPIVSCYYYDEYGNYIHGSRFPYACPKLEIINQTEHELEVRAEYISPGFKNTYTRVNSEPWYQGKDVYTIVDIKIKYNDDHYVTSYINQTSTNYELLEFPDDRDSEGTVHKYYNSLLISIETTYSEDRVSQIKKYYVEDQVDSNYDNIKEIKHFDFSNSKSKREYKFDLLVTKRENNYIEFEMYDLLHENELHYIGNINYSKGSTILFYDINPEILNIKPVSSTYIINDKTITKNFVLGLHTFTSEFTSLNGDNLMIQNRGENKIYNVKDSIIVEGNFAVYKMLEMKYGYKLEEYHGDNQRKEIPDIDSQYITEEYLISDMLVFVPDNYSIKLEYEHQPIINFNQMIKYILEKNK